MEEAQAEHYLLGEEWEQDGAIWPKGASVYIVPLTDQPYDTMVDVFLTDQAEHATQTESTPRCRIPNATLVIEGGEIRLRQPGDF